MARGDATDGNGLTDEQTAADMNERTHLVVSIPLGLKIALDKEAAEQQLSTSALVRKQVAEAMAYELPVSVTQRARKYATEEERQAALKQRREERHQLIKALLEKYKSGEVQLEPVS